MSPADVNTGTPTAVTYERLEQWREIAAAIKTALDIGGEPGMDLLIGRMAEWTEAVDEWNSALHTCWELASRGLRDEAYQWHAEGFFEAGDLLLEAFRREGWADWQAALQDRGITAPQFDEALRGLVRGHVEGFVSGNGLRDRLDALRRNVLARGDLGERLTLLTGIRNVDAERGVWTDMMTPIRRQRAGQLETDIRASLQTQDFAKLTRLIEELQSVDWEGQLSGRIVSFARAVPGLMKSRAGVQAIEEAVSQLAVRCRDLADNQVVQSPSFAVMLKAALQSRARYLAARQDFVQAVQQASTTPETASIVSALKLVDQVKAVEQSAKQSLAWLAQQEQFEKVRADFEAREDEIQKLIERASVTGAGWEEVRHKADKWLRRESEVRISTKRLCERSAGFVPSSTTALLDELEACRNTVRAGRDRVVRREKIAIAAVVGVLLLFVAFIVGVFFVSTT
ncbi:MAG: hypothetical protein ACKO6B_18055 [Planctomycetia bacterium]